MTSTFLSQVGQEHQGFIVTKVHPIHELQCTLKELTHEPSGALVMHIENDDPENLFCLSFRTLPTSSNGVPHILEHTVLCGSRKYPIKDPFFSMNRRSLNTFMNALTGSDFTCYPAASQVEKDFYNLLDVYLDAVFHPQLKELSFLQEGHRLEFADLEDPNSPLECKGVVYNEMKGSLASPDSRLWHALMALLIPDLPYAYNSGGEPKQILRLSYEELIRFHETFYHPSRCLFFFYGNFPLKNHLDVLAEKALKNVPPEPQIPLLPLQTRFKTPKKTELSYPINESIDIEQKNIVAFSWLTAPILKQQDVLALAVIDCSLMGTDASPLKAHLLQSNLCVQVDAYMDIEMSEVPYAIVCRGCKKENVDSLELCLQEGLKKIAHEGIPRHLIEAAIHQIEFSSTEITGDHSPFGLTLFMRSGLAKQHGCPPENALTLHSLFDQLLKDIEDPEYFRKLLHTYLIDNTHSVRLLLTPDPQLMTQELQEEKHLLQAIKDRLTKEEIKEILLRAKDLEHFQKHAEKQKLDCLPKVGIEDIPPLIRDFSLEQRSFDSLEVFHHACFTNHILYADLFFDLPQVSHENLPYLQLLLSILPELGVGKRTYTDNLEYIQAHTGGIGFSFSLHTPINPQSPIRPAIHLRGKALARKTDRLLQLMREEICFARFDEKARFAELIEQMFMHLENRLPRNAAKYAILMAQEGLSQNAHIQDLCYGLKYFQAIRLIAEKSKTHLDEVIATLERLYKELFTLSTPHLVISCDQQLFDSLEEHRFHGLTTFPTGSSTPWKIDPSIVQSNSPQGRVIASPVAFNAEAFVSPPYLDKDAPALHLASQLFENLVLHSTIREQGGAYGSGASYAPLLGLFTFHSYRDPHIFTSRGAFHEAVKTIADKKFSSKDLEEAKLGLIQNFDAPISPGNRAAAAYTWWREGRTPLLRQHYRDRLLMLQAEDVAKAVTKHLLPQLRQGAFVSFAGKELLEQENALFETAGQLLEVLPA
ncbi:MAG: insulinase family protein [Simkania sp.]|nr:insulinase family protein [Simkania sp.]